MHAYCAHWTSHASPPFAAQLHRHREAVVMVFFRACCVSDFAPWGRRRVWTSLLDRGAGGEGGAGYVCGVTIDEGSNISGDHIQSTCILVDEYCELCCGSVRLMLWCSVDRSRRISLAQSVTTLTTVSMINSHVDGPLESPFAGLAWIGRERFIFAFSLDRNARCAVGQGTERLFSPGRSEARTCSLSEHFT
ncbi:hypothetical protein P154DRAFT_37106 [Amniculicola lignicola CBS 123094]|uniref:Uncharacterized protein n=1 Tax=Amniculicola lignicola CBS 123094 TaxID=1392246 RepID=A0A6A5WX56_9PLEO|nr:hypothetical protein P154DRAFT_37106 [Amniculicola lignicola CBS 123094]